MEDAMSGLIPEDRALLDLARDGHEPTKSDRGRVRRALVLRIGVGTGLAGTAATTSKAAATLALTKVIAAVAIGGAIGGTGVVAYRAATSQHPPVVATRSVALFEPGRASQSPSPPNTPALPLALAPAPTLTPAPAPSLAPTPAPALAPAPEPLSAETTREPVDHRLARVTKGAPSAGNETGATHVAPQAVEVAPAAAGDSPGPALEDTAGAPVAASPPSAPLAALPPTTLEAETRLIRAGVAALHRGDAAGALALFDEHDRSFPNGTLAEERAAERVIALSDLHRCDQARAAAAEFLREHPHSPLAARVRGPCVLAPNP
jgi:hypothetical protein